MTSRRQLLGYSAALGAAGGLASVLSGCTGGDDGGFGDQPAARTATGGQKLRGRVVIATVQNPPKEAQEALTKAYHERQPDVEIVWETKNYASTEDYTSWLGTQLAADRINLDIVSGNYVPSFAGYVNFDQYVEQTNPHTGNPWREDFRFDFFREVNPQGERYLLGTEGLHRLWYYNADVFEQVGVTPPATWSELIEVCERLKAAGYIPISTNYDYIVPQWCSMIYFDQYHTDWVEVVRAREGDWNYDPERDEPFADHQRDPGLHSTYTYSTQRFYQALGERRLRFDTPQVAELMANLTKVFPRYSNEDFFVRSDQYTPFLQSRAAIMIDASSALPLLDKDLKALTPQRLEELGVEQSSVKPFAWDVFGFPSMEGPLVQSPARSTEAHAGYYLCVIDKDAKQTELVMNFLMFWASEPGYSAFVQGQVDAGELTPSGLPLVTGVDYPPEVQQLFAKVEQKGVLPAQYANFLVAGAGGTSTTDLKQLYTEGLQQRLSPREYGAAVQRYVDENFDELLKLASLTEADIADPARRPSA